MGLKTPSAPLSTQGILRHKKGRQAFSIFHPCRLKRTDLPRPSVCLAVPNVRIMAIKHLYVWLFAGFAAIGACLYGYDGVYFTGVSAMEVFAKHFGDKQPDGSYAVASSELSIMTSVINIGELVGSLCAAPLNDFFGRKGVFFIASSIVIVGVILQLVTDHKQSLIIGGRILLGYGVGAFAATSPLYIAVCSSGLVWCRPRGYFILFCFHFTNRNRRKLHQLSSVALY